MGTVAYLIYILVALTPSGDGAPVTAYETIEECRNAVAKSRNPKDYYCFGIAVNKMEYKK